MSIAYSTHITRSSIDNRKLSSIKNDLQKNILLKKKDFILRGFHELVDFYQAVSLDTSISKKKQEDVQKKTTELILHHLYDMIECIHPDHFYTYYHIIQLISSYSSSSTILSISDIYTIVSIFCDRKLSPVYLEYKDVYHYFGKYRSYIERKHKHKDYYTSQYPSSGFTSKYVHKYTENEPEDFKNMLELFVSLVHKKSYDCFIVLFETLSMSKTRICISMRWRRREPVYILWKYLLDHTKKVGNELYTINKHRFELYHSSISNKRYKYIVNTILSIFYYKDNVSQYRENIASFTKKLQPLDVAKIKEIDIEDLSNTTSHCIVTKSHRKDNYFNDIRINYNKSTGKKDYVYLFSFMNLSDKQMRKQPCFTSNKKRKMMCSSSEDSNYSSESDTSSSKKTIECHSEDESECDSQVDFDTSEYDESE